MAEPTYIEQRKFASKDDPTIKNLRTILSAFTILDYLDEKQAQIAEILYDTRVSINTIRKSPQYSQNNATVRMSNNWGMVNSYKTMGISEEEADKAIEGMLNITDQALQKITREVNDFKTKQKKINPEVLEYLNTLSFNVADRINQLLYDISDNLYVAKYSELNDYQKKIIKDQVIKLDPSDRNLSINDFITKDGSVYVTLSGELIPASIINNILKRVDESLVKKNMYLGGDGNIGERIGADTRHLDSAEAAWETLKGMFSDGKSATKTILTIGSIAAGMFGFFAGGKLSKAGRIALNGIVTALSGAQTWMDVQDILDAAEDDPVAGQIVSLVFDAFSTIYSGGTFVSDLLSKIDKAKIAAWKNSGDKFKMQLAEMCSGKGKERTEKVCGYMYAMLLKKFGDKGIKGMEAFGVAGDVYGLGVDLDDSADKAAQKKVSASVQLDQALLTLKDAQAQEHPEWYTDPERSIDDTRQFSKAIGRWNPELDDVIVVGHKKKLGSDRTKPLANGLVVDKPLEDVGHFTQEYVAGDPTAYREYMDNDPVVKLRNLTGLKTTTNSIHINLNPQETTKPNLASKISNYLTTYVKYLNNTPEVDDGAYNFYNADNEMIAGFPDRQQAADWYAKQMSGFGNGK